MDSELQKIVDSVALRLGRPSAILAASLRLAAYSDHFGAGDSLWAETILQRRLPPAAEALARSTGMLRSRGPVRLAGNADAHWHPRVAVPMCFRDEVQGWLIIVDADESLGETEISFATEAAGAAAASIYRRRLDDASQHVRHDRLTSDLLSTEPALRQRAAARLIDADLLVAGGPVVAATMHPVTVSGELEEQTLLALASTLRAITQDMPPRQALHAVRHDHAVIIAIATPYSLGPGGLGDFSRRLQDRLAEPTGDAHQMRIGVGEVHPRLVDAVHSYQQALRAATVATAAPTFGGAATWAEVGAYRILAHLSVQDLTLDAIHPGLLRALADPANDQLVETLEAFLDRAGNIKQTAEAVNVHRASVYYRLHRIEALTETDLSNGHDRLALHLGLKLARLAQARDRREFSGLSPR